VCLSVLWVVALVWELAECTFQAPGWSLPSASASRRSGHFGENTAGVGFDISASSIARRAVAGFEGGGFGRSQDEKDSQFLLSNSFVMRGFRHLTPWSIWVCSVSLNGGLADGADSGGDDVSGGDVGRAGNGGEDGGCCCWRCCCCGCCWCSD
jgi:hypothetical protein